MPTRIEPPILLSRIMMFVLAASIVVLGALCFTLMRMYPLNRAQVFFMTTENPEDLQIILQELPPEDKYLNIYKRMFIREYIKARNEIYPNVRVMNKKWNAADGVVQNLSSDKVFADFTKTAMWRELMVDSPNFDFRCNVEFRDTGRAIRPYDTSNVTFLVDFAWFCTDNYGQTDKKNYTIKIRLASDDGMVKKYSTRLDNPLGIRVEEYSVISDGSDPLDSLAVETDDPVDVVADDDYDQDVETDEYDGD